MPDHPLSTPPSSAPETTPRQTTEDEVRRAFLGQCRSAIHYWETLSGEHTLHDRLSGVAFSVLCILDGVSGGLPGFIVAPCPHPDDRAFRENEGEDWWPENDSAAVNCDISGGLHEQLAPVHPDRERFRRGGLRGRRRLAARGARRRRAAGGGRGRAAASRAVSGLSRPAHRRSWRGASSRARAQPRR